MRALPLVLLLAVLALGGAAFWKRDALLGWYQKKAPAWAPSMGPSGSPRGESAPPPVQYSRLPAPGPPGMKQVAPAGTFYVLKRKKITSRDGIKAVNPGEQVRLLERLPGGNMRVTIENADFVVKGSEVTDDLEIARDAERRFMLSNPAEL